MTRRRDGAAGLRRKRSPFERALLLVALATIAAVVGSLVSYGLRAGGGPADLRAEARFTGSGSGGAVFEVTVRNDGGATAERVLLEVTLGDVTRESDIDVVAKGDREAAFVVFPSGDAGSAAEVSVVSYEEP
ncbi:MAG: hypothetical protein ACRDJO_06835 [Actinomycetota bacterium]